MDRCRGGKPGGFRRAVEGRAAYPWSDDELIGNIATYEAICRSADSGQTVTLR